MDIKIIEIKNIFFVLFLIVKLIILYWLSDGMQKLQQLIAKIIKRSLLSAPWWNAVVGVTPSMSSHHFFITPPFPSWYFTTTCTDQCGSRVACKQPGGGGVWVTPFHVSLSVWLATFLGFATPALPNVIRTMTLKCTDCLCARSLAHNNELLRVFSVSLI